MRIPRMTAFALLTVSLIQSGDLANAQVDEKAKKNATSKNSFTPFSAGSEEQREGSLAIVRVYNIADLLSSPPNYPYEPGLPTTGNAPAAAGLGGFGGGGFGGGGGGGTGGGGQAAGGGAGFFAVPTTHHQFGGGGLGGAGGLGGGPVEDETLALEILMDLIFETVGSNWGEEDANGRAYEIRDYKQMLVVSQTASMHEQIESFLQELRKHSGADTMLTVQVHWLPMVEGETMEEFQQATEALRQKDAKAADEQQKLIAEQLKDASYYGRITCHSGQTVHLASGSRRMVIRGATPSVGFGSAAYTPEVAYPHIGTIVQVKPSLNAEKNTVSLDIWSTVTGWEEPGEPVQLTAEFNRVKSDQGETGGGKAQAMIDRVNMPTRHLATSVRLPLGVPTIIGTLTNDQSPSNNEKPSTRQLVLVVEVTASDSK